MRGTAPDGSLNSSVTIGPGNSGGAALLQGKLVAVPTAVSTGVGSDFGYLNPVAWAMRPLAYAAMRFDVEIPPIDISWLMSPYNTDEAKTRTFVGGRVTSAVSTLAVKDAQVIVRRSDRSLEQIYQLDRELRVFQLALRIKDAVGQGATVEGIASELEITVQEVTELLEVDASALSADARAHRRGEFFYDYSTSSPDGFFFLSLPRNAKLPMTITAEGYRDGSYTLTTVNGTYGDVGAHQLYRP
jgi:hypothetical protein